MRLHQTITTAAAGLLALSACGSGVSADDTADTASRTVESCGESVNIDGVPEAVVGLYPSQTEMLLRLGLGDRLVGQAQVGAARLPEDIADEATDVPTLSEDTPPSREDLLAAEPDFVFSPTTYEFSEDQGFASTDQLADAGAAAYVATGGCFDRRMTGTVDDLFTDLETLGTVFAVEDEAAELIDQSQTELDRVESAIDGVDRLTVAQVFVEGSTLSAIGGGVEFDMLQRAGAEPVFSPDDDAFAEFFAAQITPEELANREPEALVFAVDSDEAEQSTREYLRTTFPDLPAVREDRLIAIETADTMPGTLGNVEVVTQVAEALYPEAFEE
ncbi:ABC transporter substrate-binding protein [Aeromicrobium sp. CTD01-1L150]|uniref:ABC transporter substrate-binding protein n=1 Tax=Aeromicrobium sp. CTD01-1L150 TaxID=3341830 RepID=UPI0035BFCEFC